MHANSTTVRGYRNHDRDRLNYAIQYQREQNQRRIDAAVRPVIEAMGVDRYQAWVETWPDDITIEQIEQISSDMLANLPECNCTGLESRACNVCATIYEQQEIPF